MRIDSVDKAYNNFQVSNDVNKPSVEKTDLPLNVNQGVDTQNSLYCKYMSYVGDDTIAFEWPWNKKPAQKKEEPVKQTTEAEKVNAQNTESEDEKLLRFLRSFNKYKNGVYKDDSEKKALEKEIDTLSKSFKTDIKLSRADAQQQKDIQSIISSYKENGLEKTVQMQAEKKDNSFDSLVYKDIMSNMKKTSADFTAYLQKNGKGADVLKYINDIERNLDSVKVDNKSIIKKILDFIRKGGKIAKDLGFGSDPEIQKFQKELEGGSKELCTMLKSNNSLVKEVPDYKELREVITNLAMSDDGRAYLKENVYPALDYAMKGVDVNQLKDSDMKIWQEAIMKHSKGQYGELKSVFTEKITPLIQKYIQKKN